MWNLKSGTSRRNSPQTRSQIGSSGSPTGKHDPPGSRSKTLETEGGRRGGGRFPVPRRAVSLHAHTRPVRRPPRALCGNSQESDEPVVGVFPAAPRGPIPILARGPRVPVLSLIHISEPTRRTPISYAVFCL